MYASKAVFTNQTGIHERLPELVARHKAVPYRKPLRQHNLSAFDRFLKECEQRSHPPMILDSCCGTGLSSRKLAQQFPDHLIVGLDQSANRLFKDFGNPPAPDNLLLLQANCEDMWRLFSGNGIAFDQHYLLYPNPWPKSVQVQRRWHGHPVFPILPDLSATIELRSNWKLYLEEFAFAWALLTGELSNVFEITESTDFTLFEAKYARSGQALYRLRIEPLRH